MMRAGEGDRWVHGGRPSFFGNRKESLRLGLILPTGLCDNNDMSNTQTTKGSTMIVDRKEQRKHYRESSEVADAVAEALPVKSDWSPTVVAEWIAQSWLNRQEIGGRLYWFDSMSKSDRFAVAKSVCEKLVKEGRAEKGWGMPLCGRGEVMTYNGVRKA